MKFLLSAMGLLLRDNAKKLGGKDSEILASAIIYKADRLTTYDPFLIFLGREYLEKETGLVIDRPTSPYLPFLNA
jgi:hypothetical protein